MMMGSTPNNWPHVINVSNSIIGITILAMPFCFQMCGIILGFLLLMVSTWMTLVSCHLLMKAGVTTRRRSYSFLAYYTHGAIGKLLVEVGMIGLQLGTLVAQVVIIGDLGPAIVSKFTGLSNTEDLRTGLIVCLCLFVGLPLGLLKDVRALSKTSTLCIIFYSFFAVYVFTQSLSKLWAGDWYHKINFWRMEGLFQCLPIFSFAFGCQTQLFIVYDSLTEPSLKRINSIVSSAVNMCTVAYLLVGFFGYIAFCNIDEISGDIVSHFPENIVSDGIKLCFVLSISVSIPLIVFPCRTSLYTLLFPQKPKEDLPASGKIPEFHFKVITICIIVGSMVIGILVPNVEFVLGISGATMGTLICFIFPALFYLNVMSDSSDGKWTGRLLLVFGLTILICSTYVTITKENLEHRPVPIDVDIADQLAERPDILKLEEKNKAFVDDNMPGAGLAVEDGNDSKRQEPPIPQAPESPVSEKKSKADVAEGKDKVDKGGTKDKHQADSKVDKDDNEDENKLHRKESEPVDKLPIEEKRLNDDEKDGEKAGEKEGEVDGGKAGGEEKVKLETLLKEEKAQLKESERKQEQILDKLEQQQVQQEKLLEEQKQILEELKQHKEGHKDESKGIDKNVPDAGQHQQILAQVPVDLAQGHGLQQPDQGQGLVQPGQGQGLQQPAQGQQQGNVQDMQQGPGLQLPIQVHGQGLQVQGQGFQVQGQGIQQGQDQVLQQPVQGQQVPLQGQGLQPLGVQQPGAVQQIIPQQNLVNNPEQVIGNQLGDQNLQFQQVLNNFVPQGVALQGQNNPEAVQQVNIAGNQQIIQPAGAQQNPNNIVAGNQQMIQPAGAQQNPNNIVAGNQQIIQPGGAIDGKNVDVVNGEGDIQKRVDEMKVKEDTKHIEAAEGVKVRHKRRVAGDEDKIVENGEVERNGDDAEKKAKNVNEDTNNDAKQLIEPEGIDKAIQRDLKEYNHISDAQINTADSGNEVKLTDYVDVALKDLKEKIHKDNSKDNPLVHEINEGHKTR